MPYSPRTTYVALALALAACSGTGRDQQGGAATAGGSDFSRFVDTYFDSLYRFSPSAGTEEGLHQYDNRIEDMSAANVEGRIATLKKQLAALDSLRDGSLSLDDSIDAAILDGAIRAELLNKETIQLWKKSPTMYVTRPGGSINQLMKRSFAPPVERLKSVTSRLRGVPAILTAMRANVSNPPKEFTDVAIASTKGSIGYFSQQVADWAKESAGSDTATLNAFTIANDSTIAALKSAQSWLENDLLPRSHGSFALGAKNFSDKLKYDEMIDIPLDRLLAIGEANLAKDHAAFVATSQLVAPGKTPKEAMAVLEKDHPSADSLIPAARATVAGIRQFLVDHKIVDIPSTVMPTVTETPPYRRSGSIASMDTPGAFETNATEAFYYVNPPDPSWTPQHIEEHLKAYNRSVMDLITIHEVFPGHYLQFLYAKQYPTKTRKLLGTSSNSEGWAHYTEQMMVEEGYGNGDPKIKLAQLSEALLRDCRYVAGIKEHTQGLTVAQATQEYFVDQCFQQPANAFQEARRGASDPTYLYYTLGKLIIYKLRDDYQRAKGSDYSLHEFHDQFVKQGSIPLPLVRRILVPSDTTGIL